MLTLMRKQGSSSVEDLDAVPRRRHFEYAAPVEVTLCSLNETLDARGRTRLGPKQMTMFGRDTIELHCAGHAELLAKPAVAIVGTREVSSAGQLRARRLARELAGAGVVVMSGLARGVDTVAHASAIEAGGTTIAVIGTPLSKAYPAENAALQETIYRHHLLISPFADGENVFRSNFPKRNRVMAALSDATVIIEASDTSGTLHQAAECVRLNRWLFIARSVVEDPAVTWPKKFLGSPRVAVLDATAEILRAIGHAPA